MVPHSWCSLPHISSTKLLTGQGSVSACAACPTQEIRHLKSNLCKPKLTGQLRNEICGIAVLSGNARPALLGASQNKWAVVKLSVREAQITGDGGRCSIDAQRVETRSPFVFFRCLFVRLFCLCRRDIIIFSQSVEIGCTNILFVCLHERLNSCLFYFRGDIYIARRAHVNSNRRRFFLVVCLYANKSVYM